MPYDLHLKYLTGSGVFIPQFWGYSVIYKKRKSGKTLSIDTTSTDVNEAQRWADKSLSDSGLKGYHHYGHTKVNYMLSKDKTKVIFE